MLIKWFLALSDRLKNVKICCGDWKRVCTSFSTTTFHGRTGIFFDPPYSSPARRKDIYEVEDTNVAKEVLNYCIERGNDPMYRICLAGYLGEHDKLNEKYGWNCLDWNCGKGYNRSNDNNKLERLWFSPNCIKEIK